MVTPAAHSPTFSLELDSGVVVLRPGGPGVVITPWAAGGRGDKAGSRPVERRPTTPVTGSTRPDRQAHLRGARDVPQGRPGLADGASGGIGRGPGVSHRDHPGGPALRAAYPPASRDNTSLKQGHWACRSARSRLFSLHTSSRGYAEHGTIGNHVGSSYLGGSCGTELPFEDPLIKPVITNTAGYVRVARLAKLQLDADITSLVKINQARADTH